MMHPKSIEEIIILCRKHGVQAISMEGLAMEFGPVPTEPTAPAEPERLGIEHGNPTEDDLLFYSSPDGAPDRKAGPPQ